MFSDYMLWVNFQLQIHNRSLNIKLNYFNILFSCSNIGLKLNNFYLFSGIINTKFSIKSILYLFHDTDYISLEKL